MKETSQGAGMAILEEAGERSSDERSETERSGGASSKIARPAVDLQVGSYTNCKVPVSQKY